MWYQDRVEIAPIIISRVEIISLHKKVRKFLKYEDNDPE